MSNEVSRAKGSGRIDGIEIQIDQPLLQFLSRFELHHGAAWNDYVGFGTVRVATDTSLAHLNFKDSELSEFDVATVNESVADDIQGLLYNLPDIFLLVIVVLVDALHDLPLREVV